MTYFRAAYRRNARTMTSLTVTPSTAARAFTAAHNSSGTRTLRIGVCVSRATSGPNRRESGGAVSQACVLGSGWWASRCGGGVAGDAGSGGRQLTQPAVDGRGSLCPVPMRAGRWQVATRHGELWIRYLGEDERGGR